MICWLLLAFKGMLMGIAELIPGISSGTIAFVSGIYSTLFESISRLDRKALRLLVTFRFKALIAYVPVKFLGTLVLGMVLAFFLFANLIHWALTEAQPRASLHALFLGLVVASWLYCIRLIPKWNAFRALCFVLATALTACFVLVFREPLITTVAGSELHFSLLIKIGFAGCIAVFAMLLPGISGSYLLHVMGIYTSMIHAVKTFTSFSFTTEAFLILLSLGIGMVVGVVCFSRFITYCLLHFRSMTLSILSGIMIGASPTLWPFWEWKAGAAEGEILEPLQPILPSMASATFYVPLLFFVLGILGFYVLEKTNKKSAKTV